MPAAEPDTVARIVLAVFPPREGGRGLPAPCPSSALAASGFLYPTGDGLTETQFESLSRAASLAGEDSFYLSYAERIVDPDRTQDFKIPVFDLDAYLTLLPSTLDHVLVSASGSWGVYVLHSGVAVVAGDGDFVARLYADLPPPVEQAVGFVREIRSMRSEHAASWARNLLAEVLGAAVASEIWETAT